MAYSIVGILAILVHFVVNIDIFIKRGIKKFTAEKEYFFFLMSIIVYHITDGIWGFLYDAKLVTAVWADTMIYFVAMALSILFWGLFVYRYLGGKGVWPRIIFYSNVVIFILQIGVIISNFFYPILFEVSPECVYAAKEGRYGILSTQILVFISTAIYAFVMAFKTKEAPRIRYFTIASFGLAMALAIILQAVFPLLPMYSIGFLLGICVLHTFVIQEERTDNERELDDARLRINVDPMTGVGSKHAYVDIEAAIDKRMGTGTMTPFAIAMFDLNNLKYINDTLGHETGDTYIINAVKIIQKHFQKSPIYRVGGDEFVAILEGEEFDRREEIMANFDKEIDINEKNHGVIVSSGIAVYDSSIDNTFIQVFARADSKMYARKRYLKNLDE